LTKSIEILEQKFKSDLSYMQNLDHLRSRNFDNRLPLSSSKKSNLKPNFTNMNISQDGTYQDHAQRSNRDQ
jgi:hypothetical protein